MLKGEYNVNNERAFYKCNVCGNVVMMVVVGGGQLVCCGQPMEKLEGNTTDAAKEKHVPVIKREGNEVTVLVGDVPHPMTPEHYITNIAIAQGEKTQIQKLNPEDKPEATFIVEDGPLTAYEYCNLHGLWKKED